MDSSSSSSSSSSTTTATTTTSIAITTTTINSNDKSKENLATFVEGDPKAPFSIATTPRCKGGRYSIHLIAPLYPWSLLCNAEC